MPAFIDPGDRRLLIGAVAVMLLLLGVMFVLRPPPAQQTSEYPSSYSPDWGGAKGPFLLLEKLGYRTEHWESPPDELPADAAGTTLIFAEPIEGKSAADRAAVTRFVTAGGRLLVTGARGAALAPGATATEVPDWNLESKPYPALLPTPISHDAPEVTMIAPDRWDTNVRPELAVYGKRDEPVVVWYRVGKGQVIWWASPAPLSNGSIREKDNLTLFLNSVGPPGSRVLWDEYFHGMRRSLGSYFAKTPLPWAGLQIAMTFLIVLFTFSRRSGPIRMPVGDSRQSPLEFVEALGDLYQSAHAAPVAVEVSYQRLRLSLSRKLGLSAKTKLPELCRAAAARFNWTEATLLGILSHSERAMRDIRLDDGEALELVRELHEYSDRLEPIRKPVEERPTWK